MAEKKFVDMLQQGIVIWNEWRKKYPGEEIDLSEANLSKAYLYNANFRKVYLIGANLIGANLDRADLYKANLSKANLSEARLNEANLSRVQLIGADLIGADLRDTNLREARLNGANLRGVYLNGANLTEADLSGANLSGADLSGANLSGANLSGAFIGWTIFGRLDLRTVEGLETIDHRGPSEISVSTLEKSNGEIPDLFMKGAGVSDIFILYTRSLIQSPIEYYSCFISYSSTDQEFAERLYADLQQQGIRCWFAPHSLKIGDHFPNRIEEAIRTYEKLVLILSNSSILSEWVEDEVRAALEKEERFKKEQCQERTVLFPIQIDLDIEHAQAQWAAKLRRTRHIGNFTMWKGHDAYLKSFQRLMRDLKTEARTPPGEDH